jgi:hypothetical protein
MNSKAGDRGTVRCRTLAFALLLGVIVAIFFLRRDGETDGNALASRILSSLPLEPVPSRAEPRKVGKPTSDPFLKAWATLPDQEERRIAMLRSVAQSLPDLKTACVVDIDSAPGRQSEYVERAVRETLSTSSSVQVTVYSAAPLRAFESNGQVTNISIAQAERTI